MANLLLLLGQTNLSKKIKKKNTAMKINKAILIYLYRFKLLNPNQKYNRTAKKQRKKEKNLNQGKPLKL